MTRYREQDVGIHGGQHVKFQVQPLPSLSVVVAKLVQHIELPVAISCIWNREAFAGIQLGEAHVESSRRLFRFRLIDQCQAQAADRQ